MPVLKRRNRVVVFRLTQDEYENLKTTCSNRGARNISDFARSELLTVIERNIQPASPLEGRLTEVDQKLSSLESQIQRMSRILEGMAERE